MAAKNNYLLPGSYGLVVCGGNSRRMGVDKSLLKYYEKPQRYHVYDMLQPFCEKVFISCNEEQANTIETGHSFLIDQPAYNNIGPMAALLTAFAWFPGKNILFIGCDYPFLTTTDLQHFSTHCKDAAAGFYNEQEELYEPLLAWYPYQLFSKLEKMYGDKGYSLQYFLRNNDAVKFYPSGKKSMTGIDTKEDYSKAHHAINPSYLKNFF